MSALFLSLPSLGLSAFLADEPVTFNREIAPLLWTHCAGCHRPGEVGPFPLLTYQDAARRADFLRDVTTSRSMPPWKPEPGFGAFHDDLRLTDEQIALLARWADEGAEEGDPADLPPRPKFPDGWQLGTPDLVLEMPEEFELRASGDDVFRCFVIPTGLTEDRMVAAVEFRPGNRKIVHHALFFLDASGQARRRDEAEPGPGYTTFGGIGIVPTGTLGGWAPGAAPRRLPDGIGRTLRRNSDLVLQVHYHPSGKVETDRSTVGLYFTRGPARALAAIPLVTRDIDIPAGEARYRREVSFTLPTDVHAYGIFPHMHWIGREMKVMATLPDGEVVPLIWIKDWDFNWQGAYLYERPVPLPKGTRLDLEAVYDNSADNPRNPNTPPQRVRFGEQTGDEMCLCAIQLVPDAPEGYLSLLQAMAGSLSGRGPLRSRLLERLGGGD